MRILVVTGSSGGHLFPAVSFLESLKGIKPDVKVLLVLPKIGVKPKILPEGCQVQYISITPIGARLNSKNLVSFLRFFKGSFESLILLIRFKPDIVAGFGSIDSIPLIIFAWIFRLKTIIHEQNVIPGKANKLLAKFVDKVAISFNETKDYLNISPSRIVVTGNPLRSFIKKAGKKEALNYFGFDESKFTILVAGGSQGSHNINIAFLDAISHLADNNLQVIHLSGEKDRSLLESGYKNLKALAKVFSFFEEMQYAYSAADLIICRAGATTITELIELALPAIIIPYPFAYAHQLQNARVLEKAGTAIVINDNELGSGILQERIELLLHDSTKLENMRLGYKGITKVQADAALVKETLLLLGVA